MPLLLEGQTKDDSRHQTRGTNPQTGWIVGNNATLLATMDGGVSWHRVEFDYTPQISLDSREDRDIPFTPEVQIKANVSDGTINRPEIRPQSSVLDRENSPIQQDKSVGSINASPTPTKLPSAFPVSSKRADSVQSSVMPGKPFIEAIHATEAAGTEKQGLETMEKLHALMVKGIISAQEYEKQKDELLIVAKMEKLHGLMVKGVISKEEYEAQKADLLKKLS